MKNSDVSEILKKVLLTHFDNTFPRDGSVILLDVRTKSEYDNGHIDGFINIPVDILRERLNELDKSKKIYATCQVGLRGYIASCILTQNGFDAYNLSGGYRLYGLYLEKKHRRTTSAQKQSFAVLKKIKSRKEYSYEKTKIYFINRHNFFTCVFISMQR